MTSLYKRASPRQAKLLRMIEGACRNAAHAHPGRPLDDRLARGIAKRAAGTITSQWRDVLATPRAWSEDDAEQGSIRHVRRAAKTVRSQARGAPQTEWRTPFRHIHRVIGNGVREARKTGRTERAEALIDVLRLLAAEIACPTDPRTKLLLGPPAIKLLVVGT